MRIPEITEEDREQEAAHWDSEQVRAEYEAWLDQQLRDFLTAEELAAELDETGEWDARE